MSASSWVTRLAALGRPDRSWQLAWPASPRASVWGGAAYWPRHQLCPLRSRGLCTLPRAGHTPAFFRIDHPELNIAGPRPSGYGMSGQVKTRQVLPRKTACRGASPPVRSGLRSEPVRIRPDCRRIATAALFLPAQPRHRNTGGRKRDQLDFPTTASISVRVSPASAAMCSFWDGARKEGWRLERIAWEQARSQWTLNSTLAYLHRGRWPGPAARRLRMRGPGSGRARPGCGTR